jgi:hypothetical protein
MLENITSEKVIHKGCSLFNSSYESPEQVNP